MDLFVVGKRVVVTMADNEWTMVGARKSTREGFDTRIKGWNGTVNDRTERRNSGRPNYGRRNESMREISTDSCWNHPHWQQQEAEEARIKKEKAEAYAQSIRNTHANFPPLVARKGKVESKPVLAYGATVKELANRPLVVGTKADESVEIAPVVFRNARPKIRWADADWAEEEELEHAIEVPKVDDEWTDVDHRKVRVKRERSLAEMWSSTSEGDEDHERAEWESFELHGRSAEWNIEYDD